MGKQNKNLSYHSRALKQIRLRQERVKKYEKLLRKIETVISQDESYFNSCNKSDMTKQEVLDYRKKERKHWNNLNMRTFYKKKIRVNSY